MSKAKDYRAFTPTLEKPKMAEPIIFINNDEFYVEKSTGYLMVDLFSDRFDIVITYAPEDALRIGKFLVETFGEKGRKIINFFQNPLDYPALKL